MAQASHFARLRHSCAQVHSRHPRQARFRPSARGSYTDLGSCTVIVRSDTTGAASNPLIATGPGVVQSYKAYLRAPGDRQGVKGASP